MNHQDIICAISTAAGQGAIAIIRLSGSGCITLVNGIYESPSQKSLLDVPANTIHFGQLLYKDEVLDEVLISIFHTPHSFTGEESVEISCHGSQYIQQQLLKLLIDNGARLAEPGEFTQRAFLNGKLDLSQAEAIADLISSSSAASHRMAMQQMKGGFSEELKNMRTELLHLSTLLELELDFSEEDVEFAERSELLRIATNIKQIVSKLCDSFAIGNAIKNGVPVAIVGNTNVGKSTLLNAILQEEKAIVSDIAGTTRDFIEDTINIGGTSFRFIDTAGIRKTDDTIENLGIERTFAKIEEASIVLLLTDLSRGAESFDEYYKQVKDAISNDATLIILLNKSDQVDDILSTLETVRLFTSGETIIPISAKNSINLDLVNEQLLKSVHLSSISQADIVVSNARHYEALSHALQSCERVIIGLQDSISGEFISQDIREVLHYIGSITGEISTDEILGNIFRNFCIGK